jgi:DUF1680 family protein
VRERPVPSDLYSFAGPTAPPPTLRLGERDLLLTEGSHPIPEGRVTVADGFARIRRRWEAGDTVELTLPMPPRRVEAHAAVEANRGRIALQRGPLVYAFEPADNGGSLTGLTLADDAPLATQWHPDLLGGVATITAGTGDSRRTAIPYFAWANRGAGQMALWVPVLERGE